VRRTSRFPQPVSRGLAGYVLRAALTGALLMGAGCADQPSPPGQYLDPVTAATVRTVAEPLVYAHEEPAIAANARDYLSLGAIEVNSMGTRRHFLAAVSWSTIDRHAPGLAPLPAPDTLRIAMGAASRELAPLGHEGRSLGVGSPPFRPATGYAGESWYELTVADLRALSAAAPATVELLDGRGRVRYVLWRDETKALAEFVRDIPDSVTPERRLR
jgi:hypothetical protein